MPMKEFKPRWQVAGPPPSRLTRKQMDEHRLMTKFRDEGTSQAFQYKEWKKNLNKWRIIERTHLRDEVFELFHQQLETSLREEGHAIARHRAYVQAWYNLLSAEKVIDISGIQHHLTRKMNYAYNLHKETRSSLANFEAKYDGKYELGSDRIDDLPSMPSEKTFLQKAKKRKSSLMLGPNRPLAEVDYIVLRQESKKYLNALKLRVQKGVAEKFKSIQKKRAEVILMIEDQEKKKEEAREKSAADIAFISTYSPELEKEGKEKRIALEDLKINEENKILMQKKLEEKRELEKILTYERDKMTLSLMRQDYGDEVLCILIIWQKKNEEEIKRCLLQERANCNSAISQVFEIGIRAGNYKINVDVHISKTEWREWAILYVVDALPPLPSPFCVGCSDENDLLYGMIASKIYFSEVEDWISPKAYGPIGRNLYLGAILHEIHLLADEPKDHQFLGLMRFSLMLAIAGTPYSGKTIVGKQLEADYGLVRVDANLVIRFAIEHAIAEAASLIVIPKIICPTPTSTFDSCTCVEALRDPPLFPTPPPIPTPPPTPVHSNPYHKFSWKGELGMRAKVAIDNKEPIPNDVVAHLMLLVVNDLQKYEKQVEALECSTKLVKEPKMAGFCFDGFPTTPGQAAEFEKLLTGYDFFFWKHFSAQASKIAPPPTPIPLQKAISGLDAIFVLGSIAPEDALDRAMGKVYDPLTGEDYHLEMNPPPFQQCKGLAMRVKPTNENPDQIYKKIKSAAKTWPAMVEYACEWQNIFCISNTKMTVCPKHPATRGANCLVDVEEAATITDRIFEGRSKYKDLVALAKNASMAKEEAVKAAQEVEDAKIKAEVATKKYFNAQIADEKAQTLLDSIANLIPMAKELVKDTSIGMVAKSLNDAEIAIKQVKNATSKVEEVAEKTQKVVDMAKEAIEKVDGAIHCRVAAWDAMEKATDSFKKIEQAKKKALETYALVQTYLKPKPPLEEGKGEEKPSVLPQPPQLLPLEVPLAVEGNATEEEVNFEINPEEKRIIAKSLFERWNTIEKGYFDALPRAYQQIRRARTKIFDSMVKLRIDFLALLKHKSNCQEIFDEFQANYNQQKFEFFNDKANQLALKQQAADIAEVLRNHLNERLEEAKAYLERTLNEFRDSQKTLFAVLFTNFVQAELDRHIDSCSLVHEWLTKNSSQDPAKALNEELPTPTDKTTDEGLKQVDKLLFSDQFRCNLLEIMEAPLVSFPIPFWMTTLEQPYPELYKGLCQAFLIANQLLDKIIGRKSLGACVIGPIPPVESPSIRMSMKGSTKGSIKSSIKGSLRGSTKGSTRGSTKGSVKGSKKGSIKGSLKGSILGEALLKVEEPPPIDLGLPPEPVSMVWHIERIEVPLEPAVHPAIARDHQILYYRLELIDLDFPWNLELPNSMKSPNLKETRVAEESIVYITDSATERIPMWYKCFFAEEQFIIAVPKLVKEPGPLVPIDTLQWHVKLMYSLGDKFAPAKAYIALDDAKIWVMQTVEAIHEIFKEDPAQRQQPRLPANKDQRFGPFQRWVEKLQDVDKATLEDIEPPAGGFRLVIDWRQFLVALADTYFDFFLSNSAPDDIMHARTDFFLVVATKSLTDPSNEFITLEDLLETWMWFDPVVDDVETIVDSDEEKEEKEGEEGDEAGEVGEDGAPAEPPPTIKPPPAEAVEEPAWAFATEMKKFVFGLLDNGEVGLPWHTVLLYLCRDAEKEMRLSKAFNVLGAPMGPTEVALTAEEMLRLCYPNGVQGAEESGLKPWDITFLKMMLEALAMEKARLGSAGSSSRSEPCLDDFPKPPPKKPWTGMECAEPQKPKLLSVCEFEEIMDDFLGQVPTPTSSYSQISGVPSDANRAIEVFVDALGEGIVEPLKRFTLDDVLHRDATAKLRAALFKIYGRSCAYPTPLDVVVRPSLVRASIKK